MNGISGIHRQSRYPDGKRSGRFINPALKFLSVPLLALFVSCSPLSSLHDLPEIRQWAHDIARFDSLNRNEKYPPDAIIFAGSSSIRLWKTLKEDMAPYPVIQRGYGGAKLTDFAYYAPRIFSVPQCRAAVIFVANDITGSSSDRSPEEVRKLFLSVLKTFRKAHPYVPFFWIQVTPTPSRWKVWPEILAANELIRKECEKRRNTYFIRTDFAFLDNSCKPREELFVSDRLHLNSEGYRV